MIAVDVIAVLDRFAERGGRRNRAATADRSIDR